MGYMGVNSLVFIMALGLTQHSTRPYTTRHWNLGNTALELGQHGTRTWATQHLLLPYPYTTNCLVPIPQIAGFLYHKLLGS